MEQSRITWFSTLAAGIATMLTATAKAEPELITSVEGITEYRLDNGLRILLFEDPSKPQVTINLTIFVGSRHEGYGEAGMAHLLEHMLFKGTPDHPNVPKVLQDHGAEFNGTTWLDRTNYYETLPATDENLEFAIRLEADRMINSLIRGEDLASEMTVVRNEFERGENSPTSILNQRMMAAAYEWHNYGKSTIGNRADIERVPVENLREFYRRYYQPDNAMIVVSGMFESERALALIDQYFGSIPDPERELANTYTEEPAQDGERNVTLRRVGDVAVTGVLYHICSGAHPDYASLDVLQQILTGIPSGSLYKSLVETRRAARVQGTAYSLHDPGVMRIYAEVSPGNDPQDVLTTMLEGAELIGEDGVSEEEVERAKVYWMKSWEQSLADSQQLAIDLSEWASQGDWRLYFLYRDRLEQVTAESVQDVARRYLTRNNRTVGLFLPTQQAERIAVPATPDLDEMIGDYEGREPVPQGEAFDISPENIDARTTFTRFGNIQAALLPKLTRWRSVQVRLTLRYGSLESLQDMATVCTLLPTLMARGTEQLNRQQLQDALDRTRARLTPSSTNSGEATFSIETRREYLPEVLDILRQVLREPTFPDSELETIRNQRLTALTMDLTDPTARARTALNQLLADYELGDPRYTPDAEEEIEMWRSVTRDDVIKLHSEYLGSQGELSIIGDFDIAEVSPVLENIFADWKADVSYERMVRPGDIEVEFARQQIDIPDKENATYFAGTVIPISDTHPDHAAVLIGNWILGSSGLSSRLGDRVRQQEGLSYGVGSILQASARDDRTVFAMYAIANPQNMARAEMAIREELVRLIEEGVTSSELSAAQIGYIESEKIERASDSQLVSDLNTQMYAGRTMQHDADLERAIMLLTPDDVVEALKRHIDIDNIGVIVSGDFSKVTPPAETPAPQ